MPFVGQADRLVGRQPAQFPKQRVLVEDSFLVDVRDDVVRLQSRLLARRSRYDAQHARPESPGLPIGQRQVIGLHAQKSKRGQASLSQRLDRPAKRIVHRDRESGRLLVAGHGRQRRGQPNHLTLQIHQRTATGAQIQPRIGLDQRAVLLPACSVPRPIPHFADPVQWPDADSK